MLAFVLTLSFVLAGLAVTGVLAASYARAFAAFGGLRRASANCDETVSVTVRIFDPAAPRLRVVSSKAFRPLPQPALRAAA